MQSGGTPAAFFRYSSWRYSWYSGCPLGPDGGVVIKATIPAGTAPGNRTIKAATNGITPEASAQITVARGSGVGATIAVVNTTTHTAYKPPITLKYPNTLRIRGDGFTSGATVTVYLDTATGHSSALPKR
jgi:hypothetical protein